ncbi:hypothetical protein PVAP13_1NG223519 [Panicum virgatum]|uniref:Uncharacterized protein n=1 Tax=Panicum virgatum TaxID=38727 RepID=A0A8T0WS26_PANVG|nr:hypothetical protein PVAP13_1NG223519 [Panicum virgatum]
MRPPAGLRPPPMTPSASIPVTHPQQPAALGARRPRQTRGSLGGGASTAMALVRRAGTETTTCGPESTARRRIHGLRTRLQGRVVGGKVRPQINGAVVHPWTGRRRMVHVLPG